MIRGGVTVFVGVLSHSDSKEDLDDLMNLPESIVGLDSETSLYLNRQVAGESWHSETNAALFLIRCLSTQLLQTRRGPLGYRLRAFVQVIAFLLKLLKLLMPTYRTRVWKESLRAATISSGHMGLIEEFLMSDKDVAMFFEDDAKLISDHLLSHDVLRQLANSTLSILNLTESYRWNALSVQIGDSVSGKDGRELALLRVEPSVTNTVAAYAMNKVTAQLVDSQLRKRIQNGATLMHFDWELNRILASSHLQSLALQTAPFRQNERFREPKI